MGRKRRENVDEGKVRELCRRESWKESGGFLGSRAKPQTVKFLRVPV